MTYRFKPLQMSSLAVMCFAGACSPSGTTLQGFLNIEKSAISESSKLADTLRNIVGSSNNTRLVLQSLSGTTDNSCKKASTKQLRKFEERIENLSLANNYLELLNEFQKKEKLDVDRFNKVVSSVTDIASFFGPQYINAQTATKTILTGAYNLIVLINQKNFDYDISALAKKNHTAFTEIVDDLSAGLIVADKTFNVQIKIWEECEAALINWHLTKKDGSSIELETRYRTYLATQESILDKTQNYKKIDLQNHPVSKLKLAHRALFDWAALTPEQRQEYILAMISALAEINRERESAFERFKALVASLENLSGN